jgi:transposase-like protein
MYQAFQLVKYQKLWNLELCGKSVSKSFVSSLTEQLEPMVNEWQNRLLSEKKLSLLNDRCTLYKKYEKKIEYSQKAVI